MNTRTVKYQQFELTVSEATILQGMRRGNMKAAAFQSPDKDEDRQALKVGAYPDMISVTTKYEGMEEPSFEEFIQLPEVFIDAWSKEVYALNIHWYPSLQLGESEQEQAEKKL